MNQQGIDKHKCNAQQILIHYRLFLTVSLETLQRYTISTHNFCDQIKPNGEYCYNLEFTSSLYSQVKGIIHRNCSLTETCSPECRSALMAAKESSFGCCITLRLYNRDFVAIPELTICQHRRDLWSHCGVESPEFCSNVLMFEDTTGDGIGDTTEGGNGVTTEGGNSVTGDRNEDTTRSITEGGNDITEGEKMSLEVHIFLVLAW